MCPNCKGQPPATSAAHLDRFNPIEVFDRSVALKAEQDSTSMLSRAIDLAKLSQEKSFQMTQNRLIWKQNRIACMERLAARRAQQAMPPGDSVPCVAPKSSTP